MTRHCPHIGSFTRSLSFQVVLVAATAFSFAGCIRPAAGSSFLEKRQKEGEIKGPNQAYIETAQSIPERDESFKNYAGFVKKYADRYHLDWPLVLAVMKQESRFDREAVSYAGAYGLMQIMPTTQSELFRVFAKAKGTDRAELALAAYNAGLKRVMAARDIAKYLGEDPDSWESVKNTLPLLTRSYYSLHEDVWHDDKPPCGYFGGWRQTVTYVENIMQYYDNYSLALK
jgi:membrane-bound lytic murein transglycosylase F